MIERDPSIKKVRFSADGYFAWSSHITAGAGVGALVELVRQGIISPSIARDVFSRSLSGAVAGLDVQMVVKQLQGNDLALRLKTDELLSGDQALVKCLEQSTRERVIISMNAYMGVPLHEEDHKQNG